jgi:hypothetical protein
MRKQLLRLSTDGKQLMLGSGNELRPYQFFEPGRVVLVMDTSDSMNILPEDINPPIPNRPQRVETIEHGQQVSVFSEEQCGGCKTRLDVAKEKAVEFADKARSQRYLTGVVTFNSSAWVACSPSPAADVKESMKLLEADGTTDMAKGIRLATKELAGEGQRAMVVLSDGQPDDTEDAVAAAQEAKDAGIRVIAIGIPGADEASLRRIASHADLAVLSRVESLGLALDNALKMLPAPPCIQRR